MEAATRCRLFRRSLPLLSREFPPAELPAEPEGGNTPKASAGAELPETIDGTELALEPVLVRDDAALS